MDTWSCLVLAVGFIWGMSSLADGLKYAADVVHDSIAEGAFQIRKSIEYGKLAVPDDGDDYDE